MKKILFVIILLIISALDAKAYSLTALELRSKCEADPYKDRVKIVDASNCTGYILGATDAIMDISMNSGESIICLPNGVTPKQLTEVFIKWSKENPEKLHEAAHIGLMDSYVKYFPCKK